MLVTSQFVLLNVPKTGSSFVRQVLKEIYAARVREQRASSGWRSFLRGAILGKRTEAEDSDVFLKEIILPNIRLRHRGPDQHGTYSQIPAAYRDRPIISVIRNPYAKIVSDYRFRWWAQHPPIHLSTLCETFPDFPDLSFDDYLRMSRLTAAAKIGHPNNNNLGNLTVEFVQFFFKEPEETFRLLSDDYIGSGRFLADMPTVRFIRQEALNEELACVLASFGFSDAELGRCRRSERVNVSPPESAATPVRWTADSLDAVRAEERFLFLMLDQLGFSYEAPRAE